MAPLVAFALAALVCGAGMALGGESFSYLNGQTNKWPDVYRNCGATGAPTVQQSPISIPSAPTAAPTVRVSASLFAAVDPGTPLLVPFTFMPEGRYYALNLAYAGTNAIINGSQYRASHIIVRRPAEHLPSSAQMSALGLSPNDLIEQQVFWAIGNATRLIVSKLIVVVKNDAFPVVSVPLLDSMVEAVSNGNAFVSFSALTSNLGLASHAFYTYEGTLTTPPCSPVKWLIDPSIERCANPLISVLSAGSSRIAQQINPNATATGRFVLVDVPVPASTKVAINNSDPRRAWNITIDTRANGAAATAIVRRTMYQAMVGMLGAMCVCFVAAILALFVERSMYRPAQRSVWVHPKHGLQHFGFGESALLRDLEGNDGEDEEESEDGGDANEEEAEDDE